MSSLVSRVTLFFAAIALFAIWVFFFAHPVDHRLTTSQLTEKLVILS